LLKRGIRLNKGGSRTNKQQYKLRALEFYNAGYDGIYIFNNWGAATPDGTTILGELGDKVKLEKWYALGYPAEWVQNLVTVQPAKALDSADLQDWRINGHHVPQFRPERSEFTVPETAYRA
jgi:hypothetical protein